MNKIRAARAQRLIDGLIGEAHRSWPGMVFILQLPSGEEMLLPRHRAEANAGDDHHSGYLQQYVLPHCTVDPTRSRNGRCSVRPVPGISGCSEVPVYVLDLQSGLVTIVRNCQRQQRRRIVVGPRGAPHRGSASSTDRPCWSCNPLPGNIFC